MDKRLVFLLLGLVLFASLAHFRVAPAEPVYQVLKADFHVHTNYSDGRYPPARVVAIYAEYGYDVVAITDHNSVKGWAEAETAGAVLNVTVIRGEEVSFSFADGSYKHILGLFTKGNIWSSAWARNDVVEPIFDAIHTQGGLGYAAHPECPYPKQSHGDWAAYYNASFIDGWEYSDQQNVATVPAYNQWLLDSGYTYTFDHDYHYKNSTLATRYTLVLVLENSVVGVREALVAGRTLVVIDGVVVGDQWVKDAYEYSLNPAPPPPPPYVVTLSDGFQSFTVAVANSTEYTRLVEYLRAGNWTLTP